MLQVKSVIMSPVFFIRLWPVGDLISGPLKRFHAICQTTLSVNDCLYLKKKNPTPNVGTPFVASDDVNHVDGRICLEK